MSSKWYSAFHFQMKKMFWADSNDSFFLGVCFIKTKWKPSSFPFCFALTLGSLFPPPHLLCLATLLENAVIHWSESPLVTSLKILLVIHLKRLQSFTSFLRSEHLLIKHCHTVPREKAITMKWMQGFMWPDWRYRDHQFSKQGENMRFLECFLLKLRQAILHHCWSYLSLWSGQERSHCQQTGNFG